LFFIYFHSTTITISNLTRLVGVRKATHAAHDSENVVVEGIHADLSSAGTRHRVEGHSELESRLVDTGEVASARRLVLLGAESKAVHVDTRGRSAAVVLVRLDTVEVGALTLSEAVLAVELHLGNLNGVLAFAANAGVEDNLREEVVDTRLELAGGGKVIGIRTNNGGEVGGTCTEDCSCRVTNNRALSNCTSVRATSRALGEERHDETFSGEVIGVVEGLGATDRRNPGRVGAVHEGIALHDPLEFLDGVVEVQLDLVGGGSDGLRTSELNLLDEVLVALLGKAAALLSVEVHVVNIEGSGRKGLGGRSGGVTRGNLKVLAVLPSFEVDVDANLVVLEGDEGDRKTGVAAEPELEGDVEGLGRGTTAGDAGDGGLRRRAGGIESDTVAALEEHEVVGVADEGVERRDVARFRGELGPDLHPVTILAINALAADFELNLLEEAVADVVEPAEALLRAGDVEGTGRTRGEVNLGEHNLNVGLVHQIRIAVDDGNDTLVEVGLAVEGNFNGLHGKVSVALVEDLEKRDLGVARDINILSTIRNKLH
jgi:hypothetical protein